MAKLIYSMVMSLDDRQADLEQLSNSSVWLGTTAFIKFRA
jgi:hypothetical protein